MMPEEGRTAGALSARKSRKDSIVFWLLDNHWLF